MTQGKHESCFPLVKSTSKINVSSHSHTKSVIFHPPGLALLKIAQRLTPFYPMYLDFSDWSENTHYFFEVKCNLPLRSPTHMLNSITVITCTAGLTIRLSILESANCTRSPP